jgi:hypothetical protein
VLGLKSDFFPNRFREVCEDVLVANEDCFDLVEVLQISRCVIRPSFANCGYWFLKAGLTGLRIL